MQQDTNTTEQKRKSISGIWILLLAVLVWYFFGQTERTRRDQRTRIQKDTEVSEPYPHQENTDEASEDDEFNERPETGDLDF